MNFNNLPKNVKDQLLKAKELASNRLLRPNFFANVVGVGIGQKVVDGDPTETICVRIYVQSKLDLDDVTPSYLLPSSFLDIPTDIIAVGRLGLAKLVPRPLEPAGQLADNSVTIRPGSPIRLDAKHSNLSSGAVGTLGAIVVDGKEDPYILSCNHILNVNGRVNKDPKAEIVSGDPKFLGNPPKIATPGELFVELKREGSNQVDCALAKVDLLLPKDPKSRAPDEPAPPKPRDPKLQAKFPDEIGEVDSTFAIEPFGGQKVRKAGAVTGLTKGVVVDVDADFYIDYGFGTFLFTNQVVIDGKGQGNFKDIFATDGDSGSIVVDENNRAVAMLFAEAGRFAVACKFSEVLKEIDLLLNPVQRDPIKPKPTVGQFKIVNELPKEIVASPRSKK